MRRQDQPVVEHPVEELDGGEEQDRPGGGQGQVIPTHQQLRGRRLVIPSEEEAEQRSEGRVLRVSRGAKQQVWR